MSHWISLPLQKLQENFVHTVRVLLFGFCCLSFAASVVWSDPRPVQSVLVYCDEQPSEEASISGGESFGFRKGLV